MPTIGIDDLRERTAEIVADVCQNGARYVVLDDGRPVAVVGAPDPAPPPELTDEEVDREIDEWFEEMDRIAEEVGKLWPAGLSAAQAVADQRR